MLATGTSDEAEEAEAALMRFVEGLARADAARDNAKAVADWRADQATASKKPTAP